MKDILANKPRHELLIDRLTSGRYAGWKSYVFAVASSILAVTLREAIGPVTGARIAFALIVPAIFARALIEHREEQIRSILETVPDAALVIDDQARIISINSAAERQFGYSAAEVLGENVKILMPQPYQGEHDGYMRRYLETGEN